MDDLKKRLIIANSSFAISLAVWGLVVLFLLALALALWASFTTGNTRVDFS